MASPGLLAPVSRPLIFVQMHASARKTCILIFLLTLALSACSLGPSFPSIETQFEPEQVVRKGVLLAKSADQQSGRPSLLFIHGTPGSWRGFEWYLADDVLSKRFNAYAADRPGFGDTRHAATSKLDEQADILIQSMPEDAPIIVVGHSLGGSVALWAAIRHPQRVAAVILLAASVAPEFEHPRWYNRLADTWLAKRVLPESLLVSNMEILALAGELQRLQRLVPRLSVPVLIIQGGKDRLVHPSSSDVLLSHLPADLGVVHEFWPEAGHFLIWNQAERVRNSLLRMLEAHL